MITTPIAHHSVPTSRARSSMPFPVIGRTGTHADVAADSAVYATTPATATTADTTTVVNPWLGGGMCGDEGTRSSNAGTSFGFASKRIAPGRLEGMT